MALCDVITDTASYRCCYFVFLLVGGRGTPVCVYIYHIIQHRFKKKIDGWIDKRGNIQTNWMQEPLYLEVKTMVSGRFPLNMSQLKFRFSHFWVRFFPKFFWFKSPWKIHIFLLVNPPNTPIFFTCQDRCIKAWEVLNEELSLMGTAPEAHQNWASWMPWWEADGTQPLVLSQLWIWGKKMNRAGLQVKLAGTTGISWSFHSLLWNKLTTCRWFSDSYIRDI